MTRRLNMLRTAALLLALPMFPAPLQAQAGAGAEAFRAADAAYQACVPENAAGRPPEEMRRATAEAERQFRELLRTGERANDVRVALAQVLVRCGIPQSDPMQILQLVGEAETLLEATLASDPSHWSARFLLAMLYHNMPPMMGRSADAVREFERLIAQQGTQPEGPHFALPFLHLGDHHLAAGRPQLAVDVWRRGLALLPADAALRGRLEAAGAPLRPDSTWLRQPPTPSPSLLPAVIALAPLRVESSNYQLGQPRSGTTLRRLDVYTMPGGTGEMLQALQAMPGATRAGDGADLYIRGGDPAETPVFFDGGRLAFPGRWESLQGSAMGVVDASVLRRAYFSSGGFSARYGNALSGVVDVETEGRPERAAQRIGANFVQLGATVRAQLGPHAGAWGTLGATDTRLITRMNGEADLYPRAPQSVQGIGGATYEPLPGVEFRATALAVADRFTRRTVMNGHDGDFESGSGMQHAALSARAIRPDGRRGMTASLTASRRTGSMSFGVLDRDREDRAFAARVDTDALMPGGLRVRSGAELARYHATTGGRVPTTGDLSPGSPSLELETRRDATWHAGAYAEAELTPAAGLALVGGVRADRLPGEDAATLDPRAAVAYTAGAWTARAGGGVYHQGSWRGRYRLPAPAEPAGVPRRARHLVAGVERAGALSARVEAYLKAYDRYAAVEGATGPGIVAGSARGLDAIARWSPRSGPSGWVTWSLLRSRLELADGREVPSSLDVTHSATAVARLPLGAWELGATARYATGRPFTPAGAALPNAERLPEHRRLDARVTRYFFGSGRTALAYLEMLNVLDRRNVAGYTYDREDARVPVDAFFAHRTFVLGFELQLN